MNANKLRATINRLRVWLEQHAAPLLPEEQASVADTWRSDLTASEELLETKPELPIAFLGPSGQGKSSLINALLGENILAVGGAVAPCTSVITSVHHRAAAHYRAEIDFISQKDWKAELMAMQKTLRSTLSEEDTELDREEREATHKAASEKLKAVYQHDVMDDLTEILRDPRLGLPSEVSEAMSSGRSIVIEEENAITLRNKVRRYLVGREQHEDGQFWPLIGRVRIYGDFQVLANGVVLVDLPGLNDPNPAREQVTNRYLEDARYIWLVCNSQTGIDRVFTEVLRDNAFLFRLFLEGRLDAFSVITTRVDDINLEAILEQMGVEMDTFDGDHFAALEFRRREIASYVQNHLLAIAEDIASRADAPEHREAFLQRVRSTPVFSVSTSAYLHANGRMPLYRGMQMSAEETHLPKLIEHLHSITLERSYKTQVEASGRRLEMLHSAVQRFFLDLIRRNELESEAARDEWQRFSEVISGAMAEAHTRLKQVHIGCEESLKQRCKAFEDQLTNVEARAAQSLQAIFVSWESINWRSLKAAVGRGGEWFSRSLQREFNFSRDIARAYLDLLPFVWEEFFGGHLTKLVDEAAEGTRSELHKTAEGLKRALAMLRHQPPGIRESIETSLSTSDASFQIQSNVVRSNLVAQIQRTRQSLSTGMVETASTFMQPAYERANSEPGGSGIKRRMLDALTSYAQKHAPSLFVHMRKELVDGVSELESSLKPQVSKLVAYGGQILDIFYQNTTGPAILPPERKDEIERALDQLPELIIERSNDSGTTDLHSAPPLLASAAWPNTVRLHEW